MFVRKGVSIVFFVMCFTLAVSSLVLAQGVQGNQTSMPAVVENKVETPAAPVTPSEPAAQVSEAVTPAAPEATAEPAVTASPEATPAPAASAEKAQTTAAASASALEKKTEWVWGEVVSVDPANKQIVIKHLDYESYEEVQTTLLINEKTLFENVADLTGIKAGDHITVDYNIEGKNNIADLVVVEKGEAAPEVSAKGKPAETPSSNMTTASVPEVSMPAAPAVSNMTAAPEVSSMPAIPVTPEAQAVNQTAAVNATQNTVQ